MRLACICIRDCCCRYYDSVRDKEGSLVLRRSRRLPTRTLHIYRYLKKGTTLAEHYLADFRIYTGTFSVKHHHKDFTMATAAIETRNWDVLVEEVTVEETSTSSNEGVLKLAEQGYAVGNKRFEVLLSMHRQEFEQSATPEAQYAVILKILDIVCRQCVPNGRFLKAGRSYTGGIWWQELSSERAQAFVLDSLQTPSEAGVASFPPILEQVKEKKHWDEAPPPPYDVASFPPILEQLQEEKHWDEAPLPPYDVASFSPILEEVKEQEKHLDEEPLPLYDDTPKPEITLSTSPQAINEDPQTINEEKKRRRRSSLLRRSASESHLTTSSNLDGKKKTVRLGSLLKTSFWKSLRGNKNVVDMVETPEPLDVLLVESRDAFQPNVTHQVGNNRLSILMEVQCEQYRIAPVKGRESIVQELIEAVTSHWGGRFLSVTPFNDAYQILTERQAPPAVRALFENFLQGGTATAAMEALHRSCSEAGIGSAAGIPAKRSSAVKKEAVQALHQLHPPPIIESSTNASVKDMRSAAVKSLQKRKQRQGLATRIRSLTTTALTRGVSEPVKKSNRQKAAESASRNYDTTPLPIHGNTRLSMSEGVLGDLLNGLDVSGDLQMSEVQDGDDGNAQSANWL
jgi:hypothetical protein